MVGGPPDVDVFAPGHLGELTQVLPVELIDAVLDETRSLQRRLRSLPSRVGVYFVLTLGLFEHLGARLVWTKLIGTASAPKHAFVRSLGADEVIDYRTTDFRDAVRDVDMVLDPLSGDTRSRSLDVLRPGGVLVSLLPATDADEEARAAARKIRVETLLVEADHAGMNTIADLAESGTLRAHIEATFPLAEAARAHALGETDRTTGKIVLSVDAAARPSELPGG
ncbi:zinc-binding dehydrogenase [Streptomyces sp. SCSIO 30461]|uniref:zinc-binding dehydrogenase n=1 Tax=Streptomyces sp. SCSIO 30461 TaxID=3118085 RepID=UPI0030D59446